MENKNITKTSISCSNVPQNLLHRNEAKNYFKQFGQITKIIIKPKRRICIIEYDTSESAEKAFNQAGEYEGEIFIVDWYVKDVKKKRQKKEADLDWNLDPEVQAELEAMSDDFTLQRKYNLRPKEMMVDTEIPVIPKKERKTKRVWKNETTAAPKVSKISSTNSDQQELLHILKQPAHTVEEKFRILEARDKLIRLRRKQVDIAKMNHTVGTCPDMCPEKERLMREVQHQVALYEQEIGGRTMNHSLAVKQYSRSSADQESPLPHELRNVDVLQMTMGYLMHRILNLCDNPDVNLAEWFHFLWDRTRGIRKDITQQELCCQGSVELVEQCARFHIHCSARLVSEGPSVFDQKINTENLTKCLQTLKYMYHDLQLKGENCANESEFRAYVILLNLNDANFLWEVQQLKLEIQKSPEIKFALDVYSALDKNNYVKFFKLVNSTTYLNACILLRYFIQVRTRALRTILKCYTPRAPHAQFPIQELMKILAFEGIASTIDFVEYYGLSINDDNTHVILNKRMFALPDLPYTLDRAVNIIESKMARSVGEIVCGKNLPLPIFQTHNVHNSFDENGYLNLSEFSEEIALSKETKTTNQFSGLKERSNSPFYDSNDGIWGVKKTETVNKPIFGNQARIGETSMSTPENSQHFFQNYAQNQNIFGNQVQSHVTNVTDTRTQAKGGFSFIFGHQQEPDEQEEETAIREEEEIANREKEEIINREEEEKILRQEAEAEQRRQEQLKLKMIQEERLEAQRLAQKQLEAERLRKLEIAKKFELEQLQRAKDEQRKQEEARKFKQQQEQKFKQLEAQRIQHLKQERIKEEEIKTTVKSVVEKMLKQVEENYRTDRLRELKHRIINRRVITKWRRKVITNKRKRKAIDQSPMWISNKTPRETAQELFTSTQLVALNMKKRYKYGVSSKIASQIQKPITKIDLITLTRNKILTNYAKANQLQSNIYWKIDVSIPENPQECKAFNLIETTLNAYLSWKDNHVLLEQFKSNHTLTYAIQKSLDLNANGYIFIAENLNEKLFEKINNLTDLAPVVLIMKKSCDANDFACDLKDITGDFLLIPTQYTQENIITSFDKALEFLADNVRPIPELKLNTLKAFLYQHVGTELWQRITSLSKWNFAYKKCLTKPDTVVELYNEAIARIKRLVFNETCNDYADFPQIFHEFLPSKIPDYLPCDYKYFPTFWKDKKYQTYVNRTLRELTLPKFDSKWPCDDQAELEKSIYDYCANIFSHPQRPFYKIMAQILRHNENNDKTTLPWTSVIQTIALEKIDAINYTIPKPYNTKTVFNQLFVIYENSMLNGYCTDAWFYLTHPAIKKDIKTQPQFEDTPREIEIIEVNLDETLNILRASQDDDLQSPDDVSKRKSELEDIKDLMNDLERSMAVQKQINAKFQDILQMALETV